MYDNYDLLAEEDLSRPSGPPASRWPWDESDDSVPWSCCGIDISSPHHAPGCPERCPHCGSEGPDNDHRQGCPTIGTCAQTHPEIPRSEWHQEPAHLDKWEEWYRPHMKMFHPGVRA